MQNLYFTYLFISRHKQYIGTTELVHPSTYTPGAVLDRKRVRLQASGTFFRRDFVMKKFLWPFSLFRWFKKSSCQLLAKECAQSTGKLPKRLAQEPCG